jgi:hypothetical protein
MDSLTLDGKVYMKAAKAAGLVGYTPDYIGQLCRKGALDGIVLGKTWYVREQSVLEHKASKVRMNSVTTRRDLEKQKNTLEAQHHASSRNGKSISSGYRNDLTESPIQYSQDAHDLLPSMLPEVPFHTEKPAAEKDSTFHEEESRYSTGDNIFGDGDSLEETESDIEEDENDIEDDETEHGTQEEENNEEIVVPIRKIASTMGAEVSILGASKQMRNIRTDKRGKEAYLYQNDRKEPVIEASHRGVARRRSLLPLLCMVLLLFVLANIVLESTWSYTNTASKQAVIETTYNFASIGSVMNNSKD